MKITGRSSSITNAFINSIIPVVVPTSDQVNVALKILGMDETGIQCAYCGGVYSEWDHLRPLVLGKKPTGYISEIQNLIPSCGKCNQSKGNKFWDVWIVSDAVLSPKKRGIPELDKRITKIQNYEGWQEPTKIDFESIVGPEKWEAHWDNWKKIQDLMKESQLLATEINLKIKQAAS